MSPAPKKKSSIHLGIEAVSLWLYFSVRGGDMTHRLAGDTSLHGLLRYNLCSKLKALAVF